MRGLTLKIVFFFFLLTGSIKAETMVSGAISGIWNVAGSPYILTGDTVYVPADSALTIMPGVQIEFSICRCFLVYGHLTASGQPDQEIIWNFENDTTFTSALEFSSSTPDTNQLSFCRFINGGRILGKGENECNVSIENSTFDELGSTVHISSNDNTSLRISNCNLRYGTFYLSSIFNGSLSLINNITQGSYDSLSIFITSHYNSQLLVHNNNFYVGQITVSSCSSGQITENIVNSISLLNCSNILINNNSLHQYSLSNSENILTTDNLFLNPFQSDNIIINPLVQINNSSLEFYDNHNVPTCSFIDMFSTSNISYNSFIGTIYFSSYHGPFFNNTIVLSDYFDNLLTQNIITCDESSTLDIWNTIIVGKLGGATSCGISALDRSNPDIRNCCFYRLDREVEGDTCLNSISGNPYFVNEDERDFSLQAISPCIDSGIPVPGHTDPDGSSTDIGAFPFDHTQDHSPVLVSRKKVPAIKSELFRYTAVASDDAEALQIEFAQYPIWLQPEVYASELDAVIDSAVISGIVPNNATDCSILVTITSSDTESVQCWVDLRIFEDELVGPLSGYLPCADAPYYLAGPAWISQYATFEIEAGTRIEVAETDNLTSPAAISCYGNLLFDCSSTDSIVFCSFADNADIKAWNGISFHNQSALSIRNLVIKDASLGLSISSDRRVNIDNSSFSNCFLAVDISTPDSATLNNCTLSSCFNGLSVLSNGPAAVAYSAFSHISNTAISINTGSVSFCSFSNNYTNICINSDSHSGYYYTVSLINNSFRYSYMDLLIFSDDYIDHFDIFNNLFTNSYYNLNLSCNNNTYNIYNNTFYTPSIANSVCINFNTFNSIYISNNIFFYANSGFQSIDSLPPSIVANYNLFFPFPYDSSAGENNIYANPLLFSPESGDFHLLPDSPCIDSGNPDLPHDEDGSRSDIGAIPYDPDWSHFTDTEILIPTEVSLSLYPNPFNDTSSLCLYLPYNATMTYSIYNILGQIVYSNISASLSQGHHIIPFDYFSNLPSGIYFINIHIVHEGSSYSKCLKAVYTR